MDSMIDNIFNETFLTTCDTIARKFYKTQLESFWIPNEISFETDAEDYDKLPSEQKDILKKVICFFTISDSIVADNAIGFSQESENSDISRFYVLQAAIENIHNETYSLMSDAIFGTKSIQTITDILKDSKSIECKREFVKNAYKSNISKARKLFIFICIEGIFFAGSFAIIMWFKRTAKCKGIIQGNELILRDEKLHWQFGCYRFLSKFKDSLQLEEVKEILERCYEIEFQYCAEVLTNELTGLTLDDLKSHIEHLGSKILNLCGYDVSIKPTPLEFADMIDMTIRTNFFESLNTNYTKGCSRQFKGYDPSCLEFPHK